ncbi:hypothetical protein D3C86_1779190 [compost metagenome]
MTAAPDTVAPSRATATSSRVLALNWTPGIQTFDGVQNRRTPAPIRMAMTRPSTQGWPNSAVSISCRAKATAPTPALSRTPGKRRARPCSGPIRLEGAWAEGWAVVMTPHHLLRFLIDPTDSSGFNNR